MAGARMEPISKYLTDRWQTFEQNLQNDDTQNFCQQFPSRNYNQSSHKKPQSVKTASFGSTTSMFDQEKLVIIQNNLYNLW